MERGKGILRRHISTTIGGVKGVQCMQGVEGVKGLKGQYWFNIESTLIQC